MKDLNGLLDDAARGLRQAERAMQSAVKVRVPVSNATVPMQKALRKVELAKKAVMDLPI